MRQACILIAPRLAVKNQDTLEIPEIARKYVLKRRAERQDETRKRIVEAAVDLHTTIGPAHTTDLAIAKRARVTRRTFYRHFPDEVSLFRACTGHSLEKWPMPDPSTWQRISDPEDRLALALRELYTVYRIAGRRFVILAEGAFGGDSSKTARGVIRYSSTPTRPFTVGTSRPSNRVSGSVTSPGR